MTWRILMASLCVFILTAPVPTGLGEYNEYFKPAVAALLVTHLLLFVIKLVGKDE